MNVLVNLFAMVVVSASKIVNDLLFNLLDA